MSVTRINKTEDYTVMSNNHFKNPEMTLKAKGLLSLMLSLPDNWDYSIAGLVTLSKDGKDSVMGALKELEKFGYLVRTRMTGDDGRFCGYMYDIYEEPKEVEPKEVEPYEENPNAVDPPQLNTNTLNTKKTNTKESNTKAAHKLVKAFPCLESIANFDNELLDTLQDFVDMRKKQKSPMSEKAMKLLLSKLHELSNGNVQIMIELLNQSILNGWKSIYPVKGNYTSKEEAVANRVDVVDSWV